jgi:hypothetical protein
VQKTEEAELPEAEVKVTRSGEEGGGCGRLVEEAAGAR